LKQNRFVNARNARAVALALLLFVYPIIVLSFASVRYTETIHRISTSQTFDQSLFGSIAADSLAALGFLALFTSMAFSSKAARIGSIAVFAAGIVLYLASPSILELAGIATLPSLVALLAVTALANRNKTVATESQSFRFGKDELYRVGSALLVIIIILEVGALAKWMTHPFFPSEIYSEGDPSWRFAELESALFLSFGLMSPYLVVLIAFSFFYKWFVPDISRRISKAMRPETNTDLKDQQAVKEREHTIDEQEARSRDESRSVRNSATSPSGSSGAPGHAMTTYATRVRESILSKNAHWLFLCAALIIAPLLMIYPHLPGVNPAGSGVSTDEQYYMNWMSALRAGITTFTPWFDIITSTFTINNGDRPLTLVLILTIANITGSPDLMVIRFLPVALAPILVMANYLLIRYGIRSKDESRLRVYAGIGAIFAALSPQIVVGAYAGFLANWIALIPAYFGFYFLIRGWDSQNRNQAIVSFATLFAILVFMMLIHVYTWAHFLTAMMIFSGLSFLVSRKTVPNPTIKIIILVAIVATAFSLDYAKSYFFSTPAAAESDSALGKNILPQDTSARWNRLFFTMSSYVGGFLSNPMLLVLGLVWLLKKSDLRKGLDRSVLSMSFILALPIALGSIEFQTRVLYNMPFQIPAILALYAIASETKGSYRYLLIVTVLLVLATYAIRAMANLYLDLPDGFVLDDQFLLP
jgi:hypothetical protein